MRDKILTVDIGSNLHSQLFQAAKISDRSASQIVREAIRREISRLERLHKTSIKTTEKRETAKAA